MIIILAENRGFSTAYIKNYSLFLIFIPNLKQRMAPAHLGYCNFKFGICNLQVDGKEETIRFLPAAKQVLP